MNHVTNKEFFRRIGHLDSKTLDAMKKALLTRNAINVDPANILVKPNEKENSKSNQDAALSFSCSSTTVPTVADKINEQQKSSTAPKSDNLGNENCEIAGAAKVAPNHSTFNDTTKTDYYVVTVITEGRGAAQREIGIASIDIHSPVLNLTQFSDEFWYNGFITKLNLLQPSEIIIPYTIYNDSNSKIVNAIKGHFSNVKLIPLPRRHFNTEDGMIMINELCSIDCKNMIKFIEKRYYTVAAASALLKYLKQILMVNFIKGGLKIEYQAKCGRMLIDHDTSHRLELLYPLCQTNEKKSSLFGILNYTVTLIGKRQLRAKILEPYFNQEKILQIQECIKELHENTELLFSLEEKLRKFWNIDKVLKLVIVESEDNKTKSIEQMFDKILLLKTILVNVPELGYYLRKSESLIFQEFYKVLTDERYSVMLTLINDIIRPEAQFFRGTTQLFNRIQAIQDGVDEMLDFRRGLYTKLTDEIQDTIKKLSLENELPLRMTYMTTKGFYMQLTLPKHNQQFKLPSDMNVFNKKGNVLYLTNSNLVKLNVRITEVVNEIYETGDKILRELISKLTQYIDANYYLTGVISNLDIIQSYAKVSLKDGFCCPNFGDETRVIDAIHPLLEHSRSRTVIVENNIIATPEYNVFLITGPNMGGKTVYIKMIAIVQIMAQLGCFVPAKKATFRLCDRIFTRIGFEDTVEQNGSCFEIELREFEYIFKNITPNSLVIIDELCRSTNPAEGKKLAQKICEKFCYLKGLKIYEDTLEDENVGHKSINLFESEQKEKIVNLTSPFIFITSHFLHLTKLVEKYFNITNLHVDAKEKYVDGILNLEYTHKIKEGPTPIKGYGISLAHSVNFKESIILRAYEILNNYSINFEETNDTSNTSYIDKVFEDFERNLNQTSDTFIIENSLCNNLISNFMNNNEKSINEIQNCTLQSVSTKQLLIDVQNKLYDLYAGIAEIFRNKKFSSDEISDEFISKSIDEKIKDLLDNLIMHLPEQLIVEILKDAKNSTKSLCHPINENENSSKNENLNISSKDNQISKLNDSNVNWTKLYPDISFHSFMRKVANGDIILPSTSMNATTKVNEDSKNEEKNNYPSTSSLTSSKNDKIVILENKIINLELKNDSKRNEVDTKFCAIEPLGSVMDLSTDKFEKNEQSDILNDKIPENLNEICEPVIDTEIKKCTKESSILNLNMDKLDNKDSTIESDKESKDRIMQLRNKKVILKSTSKKFHTKKEKSISLKDNEEQKD